MFKELYSLIQRRQKFETEHPVPPYTTHATTLDFHDVHKKSLLHYAAEEGLPEEVTSLIDKGVNINLLSGEKETALEIALSHGNLEVAQYLYKKGGHCNHINYENIHKNCRDWFLKLIQSKLPQKSDTSLYQDSFFSNTNDNQTLGSLTKRAAEIGDLDYLKKIYSDSNKQFPYTDQDILISAAANGHLNIIRFLIDNHIPVDPPNFSPKNVLHTAVSNKHLDLAKFLVDSGANIELLDNEKNNALMVAIKNSNVETIDWLLEKNANTDQKDIERNTIWHLAIERGDLAILNTLLADPKAKNTLFEKNMYGQSAFDLAVLRNDAAIIEVLKPIFKDQAAVSPPKEIYQAGLIDKLDYYLISQYRNASVLDKKGNCRGLSLLHGYYAAKGMEGYFFDTLALIHRWDGKEESLDQELPEPQKKYYSTLRELLEQWTNDIIWFQNSTSIGPDSFTERFSIVEKQYLPKTITSIKEKLTFSQIEELLSFFLKMPEETKIQFENSIHAVSISKNNDKKISYYDSNPVYKMIPINNAHTLTENIVNTAYIWLEGYQPEMEVELDFFIPTKDYEKITHNYSIFSEQDFPKNSKDAQIFYENSPNGFTPLHIAVLFKDLTSLKKLLQDNYCDVNAKDKRGNTALDIAMNSNFTEAVSLLMEHSDTYMNKPHEILDILKVQGRSVKATLIDCLISAIDKENQEWIKFIVKSIKKTGATLNQLESNRRYSPLLKAILKNDKETINFLVREGAEWAWIPKTSTNIQKFSGVIPEIITKHKNYYQFMVENLPDINVIDNNSKTILDYAIQSHKPLLVKDLINRGADLDIENKSPSSLEILLDTLKKTENKEEKNIIALCEPIISHSQFDQIIKDHPIYLHQLLNFCIEENLPQLFERLMSKATPSILNEIYPTEPNLLIESIEYDHLNMTQLLIQKGKELNNKDPETGCTILDNLMQNEKEFKESIDLLVANGAITTTDSKSHKL